MLAGEPFVATTSTKPYWHRATPAQFRAEEDQVEFVRRRAEINRLTFIAPARGVLTGNAFIARQSLTGPEVRQHGGSYERLPVTNYCMLTK